jgi:hypothetical protein
MAMKKSILFVIVLLFALSCDKENDDKDIKHENGKVWLSGGLYYCSEQIHLDNGDTITTPKDALISFKSGDRVDVKYKEIGANENCTYYIDCEIIEIFKTE